MAEAAASKSEINTPPPSSESVAAVVHHSEPEQLGDGVGGRQDEVGTVQSQNQGAIPKK